MFEICENIFFFCDNRGTKLNWKFHVNVFTYSLWIEKIISFSKILFEPTIDILLSSYLSSFEFFSKSTYIRTFVFQ